MNRKWLVGGVAFLAAAAVLALVVGGVVGRSIVPSPTEPNPATTATQTTPKPPATVRFTDTLTDVSIAYPSNWERRISRDQAVRMVASSPDASAAVSISVRKTDLEAITADTLTIVRPLTDDLLRQDARIGTVPEPEAVTLDGLPGYRYTYTYRLDGGGTGSHIHYFLFKGARLIQVVLQAVPATKAGELQQTFDEIARTFRRGRG